MKRSRVFRISIRSVLATFLVFSGFEALISGARDPIGSGVIHLGNWLIVKIKHGSLKPQVSNVNWIIFFVELIAGLIFLLLGLRIGSRISRSTQQSASSTGGHSVS